MKTQKAKFITATLAMTKIGKIESRQKLQDSDIQECAMSAIFHANTVKDGNADIGLKLFAAVAKRDQAKVVAYLTAHGNFAYDSKTKVFKFSRKTDVVSDAEQLFVILNSNMWYNAKADQPVVDHYDAAKAVAALVKKIQQEIKEGRGEKIVWGTDAVSAVVKAIVVEGAEINLVKEAAVEARYTTAE